MITPRAPMDVMEMKNRIAMFKSAMTNPGAKGTTSQMVAAGMNMAMGAARKIQRSDPLGERFSLVNSLTTSAAGCRRPIGQTRLGPKRPWMYPCCCFRSFCLSLVPPAGYRIHYSHYRHHVGQVVAWQDLLQELHVYE